jgi:glycosyltransferase involved in cell wall biosynthesis
MTISLIYYINKKSSSLVKSLNSIINQKNKDFQLIIFNDGNDAQVEEIIKSINFNKIPHFSYFASSKIVGRGYASNFARSLQKSDYV